MSSYKKLIEALMTAEAACEEVGETPQVYFSEPAGKIILYMPSETETGPEYGRKLRELGFHENPDTLHYETGVGFMDALD